MNDDPTHVVIEYGRTGDPTHFEPHWDGSSARNDRARKRKACDDDTVRYAAYKLTEVDE